ncbi:5-oxoprolinase subunit PxpB [Vibrio hibernica]|uniref:5-oxoprolinase subunit PxpB n=1 Tax=Vibrio hibernica TaxID=2587465 RepID=UPI0039B00197
MIKKTRAKYQVDDQATSSQQTLQRVILLSETAIMVYVGDSVDISRVSKLALLCDNIRQYFPELLDIIPSYTSILIEFHPLHTNVAALEEFLLSSLTTFDQLEAITQPKIIHLPVYYHPEVAPDLISLAQSHSINIDDVIQLHCEVEYTVCAIGFAPGFAFLGSVNEIIATPRHLEPRLHVMKGSVGIADQQTAVYPANSPGGWQIIGNCPTNLFNPNIEPITPFCVGDKVRFEPVDRKTFLELGGRI